MASESRPLEEASTADGDAKFSRRGCCCFWVTFSGGRASPSTEGWESVQGTEGSSGWWRRGLMKVREWSELVAGPRWKTFIRRFNRNARLGGGGGSGSGRRGWKKFQYDPLSYSLNFDDGRAEDESPDMEGYRDFSSRFAVLPGGDRDAPPMFADPAADVR